MHIDENMRKFLHIKFKIDDDISNLQKLSGLRASYYFHKCIIEKILKREVSQSEKNLDAILQKDNFKLTLWYFDSLKEWLSSAQLPEDDEKYIKALIEKMEISQNR